METIQEVQERYILIQNDGEIETNSFELIGASTKRGEVGKIGFFGSGLKYSIAYMMRNNIRFRVFSGNTELKFTTKPELLKDQSFNRICINGVSTSYTTTMGPTWTEDWFVLREIYCNAIDETNCILIRDTTNVYPSESKTRIYIELTDKLIEVIQEWDKYFSDERTPLFEADKVYTSSLGSDDGSNKYSNYQSVKVYNKTNGSIFRRGIKVGEIESMAYDYEMNYITINEDRTAKSAPSFQYGIADMMGQLDNEEWVKNILRSGSEDRKSFEYSSLSYYSPDQEPSVRWEQFSRNNMLVVKEISGRYADEMQKSKNEVFLIPSSFAINLKKRIPNVAIVGMGNVLGDNYLSEIEMTPKMEFLLKEVKKSLLDMKYEIDFDIIPALFNDEDILGQADTKAKKIYIAKKTFDMGRREIAMTLMEENEHIISGKGDETRAFQTHIFSQWLKSMEDANGLFL